MAKDIKEWRVEDRNFWESEGKKVAKSNLWISVGALLIAFSVWFCWSIITVQMKKMGYPFSATDYFSIAAISGLCGATLRIPSSFLIRIAGGRNTIFFTTALLLIPSILTGIALTSLSTPLWVFQLCAFLSGIGGANFASSMSNIGFFFPKKEKGFALGLNAGLGNAGVTVVQLTTPIVTTIFVGVSGLAIVEAVPTFTGVLPVGSMLYAANTGWFWVLILIPFVYLTWSKMNNIVTEEVSPGIEGKTLSSFVKITVMLLLGFAVSALGVWLYIRFQSLGVWVIFPIILLLVAVTVCLLTLLPGGIGEKVKKQYAILGKSQTWYLSVLYTATFGSFIGYSAAFGLSIQFIFGSIHTNVDGVIQTLPNANAPSALLYTWLGAFVGSFIRPIGGRLSDKFGGKLVTLVAYLVMIFCTWMVAGLSKEAYFSPTPEKYFGQFLVYFLILFGATGIGNGSVFRMAAVIFDAKEAGPVTGWISAIAAYGAFVIPSLIGPNIKGGTPENAFMGLVWFYIFATLILALVYFRKNSKYKNA